MKKKILIFYVSIGIGHKSIAENIGFTLEQAGYEVKLEDILKVETGKLGRVATWLHHFINAYTPFVWNYLYNSKWFTNLSLPWREKLASKYSINTKLVIDSFMPDVIISTHATPSAVIASLKQQRLYNGKFGIAFSDFHLHKYWLYSQADFYFANIEEQKKEMTSLGIPEEKIYVCGIMLKPKLNVEIEGVRKKFNIEPQEKVILVGSGSQGTELDEELIISLSQNPNVKVIVFCGKNEKAYKKLSSKFGRTNITVLGFYSQLEELYAIANIFVTKAGALSIAEALRWQLPILISHLLPGQEEHNYLYLEEKGLVMPESFNIEEEVEDELADGKFAHTLKLNLSLELIAPKPEVLIQAVRNVT